MSFTKTGLFVLTIASLILTGCATKPAGDEDGFDMPQSLAEEFQQRREKVAEQAPADESTGAGEDVSTDASEDTKPAVSDEDSAAVLARLKAQNTAPAVVARDPEHEKQAQAARANYDRALIEMKKGNLDSALAQFRQLASQYPALAGPIVNQAIILRKKGQPEAAHKLLQDNLLSHGRNPYLLNELGAISRQLGQFKKAQASYESAIRIDPNYAKAHYNLGVLADLYLHDPALALQSFNRYQTLIPEPDKKVDGWIKDLERRAAKSAQ